MEALKFAFLGLVLFISTTSAKIDHDTLLGCLTNHSSPLNPISSAIYTRKSSNFSLVLESYIRNLRFNTSTTRKPLLILTALHESHVQAAVVCAREVGALMKIRSGGHDYEGISYWSDSPFFILDMFQLRSIEVNVEDETAWVQAGATLGEVYYRIFAKSKIHGFPAGVCPTVGAGGHFSGGGYGNMMRKYGLSVDQIVDAILVDATGRVLKREAMGEDLFWAIRGGGGASFGVIVSYKINIVRVPEKVVAFKINRLMDQDNALDIVMQWQSVASNILPHELFIRLTQDVVNSTKTPGNMTVRAIFRGLYLGDSNSLLSIMDKYIPLMKANHSDFHVLPWIDSVSFWTDFPLGTPATALLSRTPQSLTYLKRKSDYIKDFIPRQGLQFIWDRMVELQTPQLTFNPYGGRMAEIPSTETPFPHRAGNLFKVQYATNWNLPGANNSEFYIALTRKLYDYMTPYVSNTREAFLNYRDLDLGINHQGTRSYQEATRYGLKYFKANFKRLVEIKAKVDPTNFFRNEQSIPLPPKH